MKDKDNGFWTTMQIKFLKNKVRNDDNAVKEKLDIKLIFLMATRLKNFVFFVIQI